MELVWRDPVTENDLPIGTQSTLSAEPDELPNERIRLTRCIVLSPGHYALVVHREATTGCGTYVAEFPVFFDTKAVEFLRSNILGLRAVKEKDYAAAIRHLQESLEIKSDYHHANFNLACALSLSGAPFEKGRPNLDALVNLRTTYWKEKNPRHSKPYQPELFETALQQRRRYLKKIETDPDLGTWRKTKEYIAWLKTIRE